jgi:sirohydrochlorin cobaltochelatase
MAARAIVLFAHGATEAEWAVPFERIRERLRAGGARVELAYLGSMPPTLEEASARLVAEGCSDITVVPLFLAQGGHVKHELPRLLRALRTRHPQVRVTSTPPLGDSGEVLDAIATWVERAVQAR